MTVIVPMELEAGESRAALVPRDVPRLLELGARVLVQTGLGERAGWGDQDYVQAGAGVGRLEDVLTEADVVLSIHPPPPARVRSLKPGTTHVSFLDPFRNAELIELLARQGVNAVGLELIPRSTRAQGLDAVTSQANLAGYVAVLLGAQHLPKVMPMMTTAAGSVPPANVFVIGAGVAGLQAIATARRLGARVGAYDVREEVADEVRSLGARFVRIDPRQNGPRPGSAAAPSVETQGERLRAALGKPCAEADLVVTTAQIFGQRAPVLVTGETLARMAPGSVVVDVAAESGGNVDGVPPNALSIVGGITVINWPHLASRVPATASSLFSANVTQFLEMFWDRERKGLALRLDDDILAASLVTHGGRICHRPWASIPS